MHACSAIMHFSKLLRALPADALLAAGCCVHQQYSTSAGVRTGFFVRTAAVPVQCTVNVLVLCGKIPVLLAVPGVLLLLLAACCMHHAARYLLPVLLYTWYLKL